MTSEELYAALDGLGMPVAYGAHKDVPKPPYITYLMAYNSDVKADNWNYVKIENYQIELYTVNKDLPSEDKLEGLFKLLKLPYSKVEIYLDSEKLRQVIYQIQLIGG